MGVIPSRARRRTMAEPTSPRCPATKTFELVRGNAMFSLSQAAELDSQKSRHRHSKQNGAVAKTPDVGRSIGSRAVIHGNVDYTGTKDCGRKEELEVAERIKVAEIMSPSHKALVIAARHELRPAEAVTKPHVQHEAQQLGKEHVPEPVEKSHRFALHWVHEPRAVHEIRGTFAVGIVEARQSLRRHCEIRVENCQHVTTRLREPEAHGIRLAFTGLLIGDN